MSVSEAFRGVVDESAESMELPPRNGFHLTQPVGGASAHGGSSIAAPLLRRFQCHPLHMGLHRPLDALGALLGSELAFLVDLPLQLRVEALPRWPSGHVAVVGVRPPGIGTDSVAQAALRCAGPRGTG